MRKRLHISVNAMKQLKEINITKEFIYGCSVK